MSDPDWPQPSRRAAAALASFTFFEPDRVDVRWAGGFAAGGTHIEILGSIAGDEVSVETSTNDSPPDLRRRVALADLLWQHLLADSTALVLPYAITVEEDDRQIMIDGVQRTGRGMLVGEQRWVGFVDLDNVVVKISTTARAALSIRTCVDPHALAEIPPDSM